MYGVAEVGLGRRIHSTRDYYRTILYRFSAILPSHEAGPSNSPKGIMKRKQMSVLVYLLIAS